MLLGSPPDMVRGLPLRETGSAAVHGGFYLSYTHPRPESRGFPENIFEKALDKGEICGYNSEAVLNKTDLRLCWNW